MTKTRMTPVWTPEKLNRFLVILEDILGELTTIRQAQVRTAVVLEAAFKADEEEADE